MAIAYFCDRCDARVHISSLTCLKLQNNGHLLNDDDEDTYRVDLCTSCMRQLKDFLKPLPKCKPE